jgi:hypothetical protein
MDSSKTGFGRNMPTDEGATKNGRSAYFVVSSKPKVSVSDHPKEKLGQWALELGFRDIYPLETRIPRGQWPTAQFNTSADVVTEFDPRSVQAGPMRRVRLRSLVESSRPLLMSIMKDRTNANGNLHRSSAGRIIRRRPRGLPHGDISRSQKI